MEKRLANLLIRPGIKQDFAAVAAIYNQSIAAGNSTMDENFYTAKDMEARLKKFDERETILVAQKEQQVIGWGTIKKYSDRPGYRFCCETSIYFSLTETGQGYGRILQTALLEKVREFGYHHIVAKIFASNQGSIAFHQQFGFEVVGVQKEIGYIQESWQDIIIMQLVMNRI